MNEQEQPEVTYEEYMESLDIVLAGHYWPTELETMREYAITHDDCDGDPTQELMVIIDRGGDIWVKTGPEGNMLRFRNELGGGSSPYVRKALLAVALAIKRQNEKRNRAQAEE